MPKVAILPPRYRKINIIIIVGLVIDSTTSFVLIFSGLDRSTNISKTIRLEISSKAAEL
nr:MULTISPECIES: hypothetical protein [Ruminococcus]